MSLSLVHTCIRVRDPEASVRFYSALGFEPRGRLNFATAYNIYMGLPGAGDQLELTVNVGHDEDINSTLTALESGLGVTPEKPAFHPGGRDELPLIAFVADPDGYRVELIDGGRFDTPQDPAS
jgi:lactoylglutathione lyase